MNFRFSGTAAAVLLSLATVAAHANTTLTVAVFPKLDQEIKDAIPAWKKLHPDVDIKVSSLAIGDHHNAMTTALATSSDLPDVMAVEVGFIGRFAAGGGLEDLAKPPYSAGQYKSQFINYTFAQATTQDGQIVGMPGDIGPGTLFYRKDILDKAGVTEADLTKSWDSYLAAGQKIKKATGAYLMASSRDIEDIYIRADLKEGDGVYFDKAGNPIVTSPRFVKAFELAKKARDLGLDAKITPWSNEWAESFKRGTVATQMMGAWLGGHLSSWIAPDTKGLWRATNLPGGAYASFGGTFWSIPVKATQKQLSWEFIKFLTTRTDEQLASFRSIDAFPALLSAQHDDFFAQPVAFLGNEKARLIWRDAAAHIPAIQRSKYDQVAEEAVHSALDKVVDSNEDIHQALEEAQADITHRVRR
ncbi:ABC transporter substrate-binding protein [Paraburkholderia acidiphila]|uniref:Extracellular solute-binding protein n=1 Tax=Paraburkholderia acidiphila TaxID=2571747 RepID=A0A7Z2JCJ8_9BURK|nr:extracellular solute-binding protein [Paraburkholderia acidiphila]QGZ59003.1 extracellular solute-binding protein [Paraburkholderia acidiphila]